MFNKFRIRQLIFFSLNSAILLALFLATLIFWQSQAIRAQENDAIAIQVRPNLDRYSALRWYTVVKEFSGAPQALVVDGYDAVRDGRTVYVNAGNTDGVNEYSNIYLLSYSQASAPSTEDVFAGMLMRWTFNNNLINETTDYGHCDISTLICKNSSDCKKGYECSPVSNPDNKCHLVDEANQSCWRDKDCPKGIFCSSRKAMITRNTVRYANLADIRTTIADFYLQKKYYPKLGGGTYLPGITLSSWPSWNLTLAPELGVASLPLDPINTMGACAGFDPATCWNESTKTFGGSFTADKVINGPAESSVYGYNTENVYSFSPDGTIYCPLNGSACHQ